MHINGGCGPQHAFDGLHHFALRLGAAARDIGKVGRGRLDLIGAAGFENVHPVEHQRNDQDQRHQHQAGADVENGLEFWQVAPETDSRHSKFPFPALTIGSTPQGGFFAFAKI